MDALNLDTRRLSREGNRYFLAALLVFIGTLHFMFSAWSTVTLLRAGIWIIAPGEVPLSFTEGGLFTWAGLMTTGLVGQIWAGWLLGPLAWMGAYCLVKGRHAGFVKLVAWCHLLYFPTGTTVAVLMLLALRRGLLEPVSPAHWVPVSEAR